MPTIVASTPLTQAGTHHTLTAPQTTLLVTRTGERITTGDGLAAVVLNGTGLRVIVEGSIFATGGGDGAIGIDALAGATFSIDIGLQGRVHGNDAGIEVLAATRLVNAGHVSGDIGVTAAGGTIVNSGLIDGSTTGIRAAVADIRVENTGIITAGDDGVWVGLATARGGFAPSIFNDGSILGGGSTGDSGVTLEGPGAMLRNTGLVAGAVGVVLLSGIGTGGTIANSGTIDSTATSAARNAVVGSVGADTVVNDGSIYGNLMLAGGNDHYDGEGGVTLGRILGGIGNDSLAGGAGRDLLNGETGLDTLDGGAGNDVLSGGLDADTLLGGEGDDVLRPGGGVDSIDGGAGACDMLDYLLSTAGVVVSLLDGQGTVGDAAGDIFTGIEWLGGSNLADRLEGGLLDDHIFGRNGNDTLEGGAGNDVLRGDGGSDVLLGDSGADILQGGTGADTFLFLFKSPDRDRILDFNRLEGDRVDISAIDFTNDGAQPYAFIGTAGFSAPGQIRALAFGNSVTVYGNTDGTNTTVEFSFTLVGLGSVIAGDFVL